MPTPIPVSAPANYAPVSAIGFADADGTLAPVSADRPLPVIALAVPVPAPLAGLATGSTLAGPFVPSSARPVVLTLAGTWTGTVRVVRSTDNGTTRHLLTAAGSAWGVFTANCCEPVWEETADAALYLDIALTSGSASYRIAQ